MFEFDEDRPSITGRRIESNIPPTVPGYAEGRRWLTRALAGMVALLILVVLLAEWLR